MSRKTDLKNFEAQRAAQTKQGAIDAFRNNWVTYFAAGIPKKDLDKYVLGRGGLLWHVFSWNLLRDVFLTGDDARAAYDRQHKQTALYYEPYEDDGVIRGCSEPFRTAKALDNLTEIYVMEENGGWTYIKTHEGDDCGPYFYRPNRTSLPKGE